MNSRLQNEMKETMTFEELQDMVGPKNTKRIKWLVYDELKQFSTCSQLFARQKIVVVLLMIKGHGYNPVGHYIVLINHPGSVEHFDSYGLSIDQELHYTHAEPLLKNILSTCTKKLISNTKKLQRFKENINTCGRWIAARILLSHLTLIEFIQEVTLLGHPNDETVTLMTMLLPFHD